MELHNYRFSMILGGGVDVWAFGGNVYGREDYPPGAFIHTSVPKTLDRNRGILYTYSGSQYLLINPEGDKEEIFDEIEQVIAKGGYERH